MALSMFDQMLFALVCGHTVVLGRLENAKSWTCEACGKVTDLSVTLPARRLPKIGILQTKSTPAQEKAARGLFGLTNQAPTACQSPPHRRTEW
jgi:hypothetical protein